MKNHIYIMNTSILDDEKLFFIYYKIMPESRKKKIDAFRFLSDKKLSLGAGILLREALIREGIYNMCFSYNKNEKPFISCRNDIFFNLSHSGELAVCAVSNCDVGVDIEKKQHFEASLLDQIFQNDEIQYIISHTDHPDNYFNDLWTIKESIMKYFGTGLMLEPDKILVDLNFPVKAYCEEYDTSDLHFTQYDIPGYSLAVCSKYDKFTNEIEWINKL